MAFDDGIGNRPPVQTPDFSAALDVYTSQVETLGIGIKAKEAILADVQAQIDAAKIQVRDTYNTRIDALEKEITTYQTQIAALQLEHTTWQEKVKERQAEHDSIDVDNSAKQARLDTSWADFHTQSAALLVSQNQLKLDQATLASAQAQLVSDRAAFESTKQSEMSLIDAQKQDTLTALNKANATLNDAQNQKENAQTLADQVTQDRIDLETKITAAQEVLAQADAVTAQKAQNAIDQKNNSAQALTNQTDANEIKVARIAVNNQQQSVSAREQAVALAEQKIGG